MWPYVVDEVIAYFSLVLLVGVRTKVNTYASNIDFQDRQTLAENSRPRNTSKINIVGSLASILGNVSILRIF